MLDRGEYNWILYLTPDIGIQKAPTGIFNPNPEGANVSCHKETCPNCNPTETIQHLEQLLEKAKHPDEPNKLAALEFKISQHKYHVANCNETIRRLRGEQVAVRKELDAERAAHAELVSCATEAHKAFTAHAYGVFLSNMGYAMKDLHESLTALSRLVDPQPRTSPAASQNDWEITKADEAVIGKVEDPNDPTGKFNLPLVRCPEANPAPAPAATDLTGEWEDATCPSSSSWMISDYGVPLVRYGGGDWGTSGFTRQQIEDRIRSGKFVRVSPAAPATVKESLTVPTCKPALQVGLQAVPGNAAYKCHAHSTPSNPIECLYQDLVAVPLWVKPCRT